MGRLFLSKSFFFFFFFSKAPHGGDNFKELLLPLHSLPPFPKHDKQMKEPIAKGGVDFFPLSFYLPSPHTSLPRSYTPRLLDSSLPLKKKKKKKNLLPLPNPISLLLDRAVTWGGGEGFEPNLLVDIVPLFKFQ